MRAHYLQHVPFEGIGSLEPWLRTRQCTITHTRLFLGESLPAAEDMDFLVVMGGPMSVNDEAEFPWLAGEKTLIRDMMAAGKPVLGICLGAQLIASAMGARVYRNQEKEIGWWPVQGVDHGQPGCFTFPQQFQAFHWHGETFDLPDGATLLASTAACTHQAFQLGKHVIGLQFHLETTLALARELVLHCGNELVAAPGVQTAEAILAATAHDYQVLNHLMGSVIGFLTDMPVDRVR